MRDIILNFPADMITRAYSSVINLLHYPYAPPERFVKYYHRSYRKGPPWIKSLVNFRQYLFQWKLNIGLICGILTLIIVSLFSLKTAFFYLLFAALALGYPVTQFQSRHMFMLSFAGLWVLGFVLHFIWRIGTTLVRRLKSGKRLKGAYLRKILNTRRIRRAAIFWTIILLINIIPYLFLRSRQNSNLHSLFRDNFFGLERQELSFDIQTGYKDSNDIFISSPELKPEMIYSKLPGIKPNWYSEYLIAVFDGTKLTREKRIKITAEYNSKKANSDFTTTKNYSIFPGERRLFFLPIYYSKFYDSHFSGLRLKNIRSSLLSGLYLVKEPQKIPFSTTLWLPEDMKETTLCMPFNISGKIYR
ncbi:MAG: hypothetical protein U9N73_11885 [Candidatus Auribacterota bacterium]|nr:hypothetical protein [Candidatus Auribacterota bacterium]